MIIIYLWIALCIGFLAGAVWTGMFRKEAASERYNPSPSAQWVRPTVHEEKSL